MNEWCMHARAESILFSENPTTVFLELLWLGILLTYFLVRVSTVVALAAAEGGAALCPSRKPFKHRRCSPSNSLTTSQYLSDGSGR